MGEWKEYKLGEILAEKGYIRGPFGSALKRGELKNEGIAVYEQQHAIYESRIFRFYIDSEKFKQMKRFAVSPDDIIISCSGTVGEVSIIKKDDPIGIISQALLLLRVNKNIILPEFLRYFFKTSIGHNSILSRSSGSVQVNIAKRATIESIPINLPTLIEQDKIVSVLKSLDDKIENNRKINENLEQQAQALFKSWFVDFEPFRNQPFVDSELGMIPEGWRVGNIYEYIDVIYGAPYQSSLFNSEGKGFPLIRIRDLKSFSPQFYTEEKLPNTAYVIYGDVVAGMDAEFVPVIWRGETGVLNQRVCKFIGKNKSISNYYIINVLRPELEYVQSYKTGTTVSHLGKSDIDKFRIITPPLDIITNYSNLVNPMLDEVVLRSKENLRLAQLRDTLLPKLMSGEINLDNIPQG